MADNTQLPVPTSSGDVIAADDIAGVKYQRVKVTIGADGVDGGDVSSSNPLPVEIQAAIKAAEIEYMDYLARLREADDEAALMLLLN